MHFLYYYFNVNKVLLEDLLMYFRNHILENLILCLHLQFQFELVTSIDWEKSTIVTLQFS